jgi:hypothetical protein
VTPLVPARRIVLVLLCAVTGLRLAWLAGGHCLEALQLDLAAYVTAGEAVGRGVDPYRTHPDRTPPVWDGKAEFTHSRFLYPPLVARLFRPAAAMPYLAAKTVFTALSFLALLAATLLLWRAAHPAPAGEALLLLLSLLFTAYPVLLLLERGQVDGFTFLLLVMAFRPALSGRVPGPGSGALLALATLLKLNVAAIALFFCVRRWWRGLVGFALGVAALVAASAILDGPRALSAYLTQELPRIARHGEGGAPAMRLPAETLARLRAGAPEGHAWRDGRLYRLEGVGFAANASAARVINRILRDSGRRSRAAPFTLLILAASLALAVAAVSAGPPGAPAGELAFLSLVLSSVLLAGPFTWAMNAVWLLAAGVLLATLPRPWRGVERIAVAATAAGLLLAWIPDQYAAPWLYGARPGLGDYKYVASELLVLLGASGLLAAGGRRPPA